MRTEKQKLHKHLAFVAIGTMVIGLAGCVAYPPQEPRAQYHDGYYSYYDYPNTYQYYDSYGQPYPSGYSDDPNLRYDADRSPDHTDDHNFHNRDDFDHWDY